MSHRKLMLASLIIVVACAPAFGDWTYNPGTGHWYQLTAPGLTWTQAEDAAVKLGGHLVAIGSLEENTFVRDNFGAASSFVLWIGFYQLPGSAEPAGGWFWSNGETVVYTNWSPDSPNDGGFVGANPENFGHMYGSGQTHFGLWNDIDVGPPTHIGPGVIERAVDPAVPALSEWGVVVMTILTLTAGTIILIRPRLARA